MPIVDFLHREADCIADNPVVIPFRWDYKPDDALENNITITPLTVETWFRIKPFVLQIRKEDYDLLLQKEKPLIPDIELVSIITKYDEILLEIIFLGIHNKPGELPEFYKKAIRENCTWDDIFILLNAILFRIGQNSFYKSITTLRSVSPWSEQELIAAQKNLESWKTAQVAL